MAPLRVALLGCGALAEILAERVYPAARDDVAVVAAVDVRADRAAALAGRLGAEPFESLDQACAATAVEAVDVRLPHHLHRVGAELAAAAGLPFLVEKPMAASLEEARAIRAVAQDLGPACGVAENYAFLEPVLAARRLLDEGAIGELLAVQSTRVFALGDHWRRDGWRVGQGVVVDQATHVARLVRTVCGELAEVSAYASGSDSAAVAFRLASGVVGTQTYCWGTPAGPVPELSLYGTTGSIAVHVSYDEPGGGAQLRRSGAPDEWHGTGTGYYDSLAAVLADWARAVRGGSAPAATLEEGVRDTAVMAAILASVRSGAPVTIDDPR